MKKMVKVMMLAMFLMMVMAVPAFAASPAPTTSIDVATTFGFLGTITNLIASAKSWVVTFSLVVGGFALVWQGVLMLMQSNDQQVVEQGKKKMKFIAMITAIVAFAPTALTSLVGLFNS